MQTVMVDYRDIIMFHLSKYDLQGCMNLKRLRFLPTVSIVVYSRDDFVYMCFLFPATLSYVILSCIKLLDIDITMLSLSVGMKN